MPKIRALHPDFWTDDLVVSVSPLARLLFQGLWNFSCDNGHVRNRPRQLKLRILPADDVRIVELLAELAEVELITMTDEWIKVINLRKRQRPDLRYFTTCEHEGCEEPERTTSQRESRRAHGVQSEGARRADEVRTDLHATDGDGDGDSDGESDGDIRPPASPADAAREDVERICKHLADRIEGNGGKRPSITKKWRDAARLMLDRDGRSEDQVHGAIEWCQRDEFWRANILSLPKLREKYETLRLQAERRQAPRNDIDWDEAFERARYLDGQNGVDA